MDLKCSFGFQDLHQLLTLPAGAERGSRGTANRARVEAGTKQQYPPNIDTSTFQTVTHLDVLQSAHP